jgi:hypothetical protein
VAVFVIPDTPPTLDAVEGVDDPEQVSALVEADREQVGPPAAEALASAGAAQQSVVGVHGGGVVLPRERVRVDPVVDEEQRCPA